MTIQQLLREKNMSVYRLSKESHIPYTTVNEICNGKVELNKCSAETVYHLAQALDISMEKLVRPCLVNRGSFENFKSTVCHRVKEYGDTSFIRKLLKGNFIPDYFYRKWYPECFYLLGMLDYLSRENNIPLCKDYDYIRRCKMEKLLYPAGIWALYNASNDPTVLDNARKKAIPEFLRFNIVENEVRNVV